MPSSSTLKSEVKKSSIDTLKQTANCLYQKRSTLQASQFTSFYYFFNFLLLSHNMVQSQLFSSGFEVATFVTSSGLLQRSWDVITSRHAGITYNMGVGLSWKVYKEPNTNVTIIAIEATLPNSSNLQSDSSLNSTAVSLFIRNHQKFDPEILNSKINSTPLIVTGHGLGGTVASLLTISLLDSIGAVKNRPLCITFGSPLVGNKKMQKAISRSSIWNSCFLHVVSYKDPIPRLFIKNATSSYTPFGTILLCSDESSTCFENPESVLEVLIAFGAADHVQNQGFQSNDYGNIVENLNLKAICKDFTNPPEDKTHSDSLETGISMQLQALGFTDSQTSGISMQLGALELAPQLQQQQQQNIDVNVSIQKIKKQEVRFFLQRRISFDPSKKLKNIKGHMAQLEWYKKETKKQQIGYYDSYKKKNSQFDHDVLVFHNRLTNYWEKMVQEAEMKPRREGVAFEQCLLSGGTNYRRMVEPLAIADYYKEGGKDYINNERSNHFKKLEQWATEGNTETSGLTIASRKNVEALLTLDSCFWAHVEEALFSCKELKDGNSSVSEKEEASRKLLEFESYVYGKLINYAVSPEIFLRGSSYMRWWNQYKEIKGSSYSSALANFMNNADNYNVEYAGGTYDFH